MKKQAIFFLFILCCYSCASQKKEVITKSTIKLEGKKTNIRDLIEIDGYYPSSNQEYGSMMFFEDGTWVHFHFKEDISDSEIKKISLKQLQHEKMAKIKVDQKIITVIEIDEKDYISLTDMVKDIENGLALIEKWLRNKNTIEFLGIWEEMYNPHFNSPEFEGIKNMAGLNRFVLSVKQWVEKTNSTGLMAKAGRYGGTYAHKDIAFEFASWVSPQFKLYLLKEFQRLKEEEQKTLGWSAKRELSKINYHIHTDAIKQNLIPDELTAQQTSIIYANEADVLNVALFGLTAKEWKDANPALTGNMRDYASINEMICLANIENLNAVFINDGLSQKDRLIKLNQIARHQMNVLYEVENRKLLK